MFGCDYAQPGGLRELRTILDDALAAERTTVIEIRTDRAENLALHRRVAAAVQRALANPQGPEAAPRA
jgi:2-succinyl-5-enolpyruvyl-6-hydroxy-3-cyclohexene-1-carboxylate synthase